MRWEFSPNPPRIKRWKDNRQVPVKESFSRHMLPPLSHVAITYLGCLCWSRSISVKSGFHYSSTTIVLGNDTTLPSPWTGDIEKAFWNQISILFLLFLLRWLSPDKMFYREVMGVLRVSVVLFTCLFKLYLYS